MDYVLAILNYLATSGVGSITSGSSSGNLFRTTLPSSPIIATAVVPQGGTKVVGSPTRYPMFQILHRCEHAGVGLQTITKIASLIDNKWNVLPNFKGRILHTIEPGGFFKDANNQVVYYLNGMVEFTDK